ncbi:MAG: isoaspartyl peptidase/L-asparaginase, partial [Proteobacteria bacterium]|nr:isoaspartyl peptidase/L-asparaginase [Pseudomonadota bacterium]
MQKPTYLALGVIATLGAMWAATACQCEAASKSVRPGFALAIHGGAGTLSPGEMTAEKAREYHVKLKEALEAGRTVLAGGGKSLDAVIAAITVLEDSPLFNAGKGAVFTSRGTNELDASIMDGKDRNAGAVAGITTVKNPILLAREVMDASPHVMLQGRGAEVFARERGVEIVEPSYFFTERRWQQLKDAGSNQDNKHRPDPHPG